MICTHTMDISDCFTMKTRPLILLLGVLIFSACWSTAFTSKTDCAYINITSSDHRDGVFYVRKGEDVIQVAFDVINSCDDVVLNDVVINIDRNDGGRLSRWLPLCTVGVQRSTDDCECKASSKEGVLMTCTMTEKYDANMTQYKLSEKKARAREASFRVKVGSAEISVTTSSEFQGTTRQELDEDHDDRSGTPETTTTNKPTSTESTLTRQVISGLDGQALLTSVPFWIGVSAANGVLVVVLVIVVIFVCRRRRNRRDRRVISSRDLEDNNPYPSLHSDDPQPRQRPSNGRIYETIPDSPPMSNNRMGRGRGQRPSIDMPQQPHTQAPHQQTYPASPPRPSSLANGVASTLPSRNHAWRDEQSDPFPARGSKGCNPPPLPGREGEQRPNGRPRTKSDSALDHAPPTLASMTDASPPDVCTATPLGSSAPPFVSIASPLACKSKSLVRRSEAMCSRPLPPFPVGIRSDPASPQHTYAGLQWPGMATTPAAGTDEDAAVCTTTLPSMKFPSLKQQRAAWATPRGLGDAEGGNLTTRSFEEDLPQQLDLPGSGSYKRLKARPTVSSPPGSVMGAQDVSFWRQQSEDSGEDMQASDAASTILMIKFENPYQYPTSIYSKPPRNRSGSAPGSRPLEMPSAGTRKVFEEGKGSEGVGDQVMYDFDDYLHPIPAPTDCNNA